LNPSLSVVVPTYNVQSVLAKTVEELLEIVPELTSPFEIVLVDDGSTDATVDIARELSLRFPQVQLLLQPARLGPQEALRSALRFVHGEAVLVCPVRADFDLHEIRKLWARQAEDCVVCAAVETRSPLGNIPPVPTKGTVSGEGVVPEVMLLPRRLLTAWQQSGDPRPAAAHLRARGFGLRTVEIRARRKSANAKAEATPLRPNLFGRLPSATEDRRTATAAARRRGGSLFNRR
jgi:glycosyltransferase involved in cell wall biosynthesis